MLFSSPFHTNPAGITGSDSVFFWSLMGINLSLAGISLGSEEMIHVRVSLSLTGTSQDFPGFVGDSQQLHRGKKSQIVKSHQWLSLHGPSHWSSPFGISLECFHFSSTSINRTNVGQNCWNLTHLWFFLVMAVKQWWIEGFEAQFCPLPGAFLLLIILFRLKFPSSSAPGPRWSCATINLSSHLLQDTPAPKRPLREKSERDIC